LNESKRLVPGKKKVVRRGSMRVSPRTEWDGEEYFLEGKSVTKGLGTLG